MGRKKGQTKIRLQNIKTTTASATRSSPRAAGGRGVGMGDGGCPNYGGKGLQDARAACGAIRTAVRFFLLIDAWLDRTKFFWGVAVRIHGPAKLITTPLIFGPGSISYARQGVLFGKCCRVLVLVQYGSGGGEGGRRVGRLGGSPPLQLV